MNLEEHIGNAREFLSAIALDDVALPQRMRGRALSGAAHDAVNALGHRIGDHDHPTAKIATRQRRVIGDCVERGLLAVSDMDAYMAHAIPLQSHFYDEPMDGAIRGALAAAASDPAAARWRRLARLWARLLPRLFTFAGIVRV